MSDDLARPARGDPLPVGAHRAPGPHGDPVPRVRSEPRHRARRARWKPPLEPVEPAHTEDGGTLLR